jgi:phage gpG-like protein
MNAEEKINAWFAKFQYRMEKEVPDIVAETATAFFRESFVKQSWDGVPWQVLNTKYEARKTRGKGQILRESGNMEASIRPSEVTANRVVISAGNQHVPYARVHNEGLRVRGVRYVKGYHNSNFRGKGKRIQIQPHTRKVDFKMPKRQYMGHSKLLNNILIERLTETFNTK